ncbi:hypothetical protein [Mesorhizobium sp.]|uniref:hypothetical protein n=1 Tax=Mesorhizobium sp. TaxID=1871066 RepID=UPI000FE9EAF8|nr:hypothetical protein [Mesorhizobium sp.]RWC61515.1 MAG: hypothetical protein EOS56_11085 [Mesorhizobium sp.]RWC66753.1 MAG: hypothetical protein EOS29_03310 [Mesorhizobium sp.]
MSIRIHLNGLVSKGSLHSFMVHHPLRPMRALYFTPAVFKELNDPASTVNYHGVRADCLRVMERWVSGGSIAMSMSGSGKGAVLARLDPPPPDAWELRITEPNVQFRLFCQFVEKDVLVATHMRPRGTLLGKKMRSGKTRSSAWTGAMWDCKKACQSLITPHVAIGGDDPASFISESYYVV